MHTLADIFDLPPIDRLHHERTQRIHAVIRPGAQAPQSSTCTAADYCLAHHALEGAEAAARAGDAPTFDWYVAHPDAGATTSSIPTAVGTRVVVAPTLADLPRSAISETPTTSWAPAPNPPSPTCAASRPTRTPAPHERASVICSPRTPSSCACCGPRTSARPSTAGPSAACRARSSWNTSTTRSSWPAT